MEKLQNVFVVFIIFINNIMQEYNNVDWMDFAILYNKTIRFAPSNTIKMQLLNIVKGI